MTFRPGSFVRLYFAARPIGWLRPELAARLRAWPAVFDSSADKVVLLEVEGLDSVVETLAAEGFVPGWRHERYRIEGLFDIERAAARPFGLTTRAVHVNGIVGERLWLARRAATKPIDPGLLDTLVGGGVASGFSSEETLVKEAWEEAGIPGELAKAAKRGGTARILREVPQGVQSELVEIFHLELPAGFEPRNQDGEVSEFLLVPAAEAPARELTEEARLAVLDYLRSSGR